MYENIYTVIRMLYYTGTLLSFLIATAIVIFIVIHQRRVNKYKLEIKNQELINQRNYFINLQKGEEQERKRIAEELHDGISAKLSGTKITLEVIEQQLNTNTNSNLPQLHENLSKCISHINESIIELRDISHNLQPDFFNGKSLELALNEFVKQLNLKGQINFNFEFNGDESFIADDLKLNVFRITNELNINVLKHSKASESNTQINIENDLIEICVEDNGIGFDTISTKKGIGLTNIQNRIKPFNGTIEIDSNKNGTSIIIYLPKQFKNHELRTN